MLKEKAVVGVPQTVTSGSREKEWHIGNIVPTVVFVILGLIVPQGTIYETLSPFGISLAAAVYGTGAIPVYVAIMLGYLLAGHTLLPLRYLAAVAVTGAAGWTCGVLPAVTKSKWFAPLLACIATLASGLTMESAGMLRVFLTLAESLAAGGFAYFFKEFFSFLHKSNRNAMVLSEQTGVVLLGAVAIMAIAPLEIYAVSVGRVIAGIFVMLFARCGREQSGAVAGTILGVAMALCAPDRLYLAVALAFGGLLGGMFSRYGRFAVAGVYLIANVLICLIAPTDLMAAISIYETAAACVIFVLIPRKCDKPMRRYLVYGQFLPAVEGMRHFMTMQLDVTAKAMHEVAGTVDTLSKKLSRFGAPDLGSMYRAVGDSVCKNCSLNMYCWESNFADVTDAFNQLTPILREKGYVEMTDFGGYLARSCRRPREIVAYVNDGYRLLTERENAWSRLREVRAVIGEQFSDMGDVLCELGENFGIKQRVDPETAGRVVSLCEDYGMPVEEAVCFLDRRERITLEILTEDVGVCIDGGKWFEELQTVCGREFDHPTTVQLGNSVKITFTERPLYRVQVGIAQSIAGGEKLSGDTVEQYSDGGISGIIISDGMGSGGRAAVDSTLAAGMTAKLLAAGLQPDTVLKMVNTALIAKSGDESLTTLDVLLADVFTGHIKVYKAGAASSLLYSGGRVSRIESPSLPIGILRDTGFAVSSDTVSDGDIILMLSDGVLDDGIAWVEEFLRDADVSAADNLAQAVLDAAHIRAKNAGHTDDMTVVAVCFTRRNSEF